MIPRPPRGVGRAQALAAALLASLVALAVGHRLDPALGDRALALAPTPDAQVRDKIAVLTITEDTLAGFAYRSPIDRGFLADLILRLDAAGARAIGLDILLDQPSDPAKDARLIAALETVATPVVLARADADDGLSARQAAYLADGLAGRTSGWIALERDEVDGIVRHLPRPRGPHGTQAPGFAEALAGATPALPAPERAGRILYSHGSDGAPAFATYPAQTAALLPDAWFTDRIVLIGTDLPTLDRHPTPLVATRGAEGGSLPGVTIHAHLTAQHLAGLTLATPPPGLSLALTLAVALLVAGVGRTARPAWLWLGGLLGLAAYAAGAAALIRAGTMLPPLAGPPLAGLATALLLGLARWRAERAERAFLQDAFARYVSPAVVSRIASGRLSLALGGETREVTYVFTDLEGFTTLAETLPPQEVGRVLNGYLDGLCDRMTAHGATIDKIVGDAVIGFFGAPDDDPDQATHAVRLALALDAFAQDHRKALAKEGLALGVTRIGVHKGPAIVGNFGGARFFDYTGLGDTVNAAARLEGANKALGTRLLVSETVASDCTGDRILRPAARLLLKGRSTPLACFEPLAPDAASAGWLAAYRAAYASLDTDPDAAARALETLLAERPDDPLARFHLARLHAGARGATVTLESK